MSVRVLRLSCRFIEDFKNVLILSTNGQVDGGFAPIIPNCFGSTPRDEQTDDPKMCLLHRLVKGRVTVFALSVRVGTSGKKVANCGQVSLGRRNV